VFSNGGDWVTGWAPGAAVISTYPVDVNGSIQPEIRVPHQHRESLDFDDFRGGFAAWSGTSFAAPAMTANVVKTMLEPLQGPPSKETEPLRLDQPGKKAADRRLKHAIQLMQSLE
jgi:hypothetical protein